MTAALHKKIAKFTVFSKTSTRFIVMILGQKYFAMEIGTEEETGSNIVGPESGHP